MRIPRRTKPALLAVATATALLALSGSARAQTSDTDAAAAKSPLAGDGMWIWYVKSSAGGKVGKIAKRAHRFGIETVFVKSGDGTTYWNQFSSRLVSALKGRGLNVCAWQFIYGRNPTAEASVANRAVQRGADCLVLDVEGQYEGRYAQASTYMTTLRSMVGADYPIGLASFPYVDYHPALPFSVFLGPGGAQYNLPQLYWKDIGTTPEAGYAHTWVWNRIYGRQLMPLGQVYNHPKAGQIKRFRALALSHGFHGVSWWSWQSAGNRQWKALSAPVGASRTLPYDSYPLLRLNSKGDFVAWAQQLLVGAGYTVPINGYFQAPMQQAVIAFQAANGLPQSGSLDSPTWTVLLRYPPVPVRWTSSGATVATASSDSSPLRLRPPKSAKLPAKRYEIHPPTGH